MTDLPDSWETEDLEQLTALACQYLATVVRNRARNKLQQEIVKQENKNNLAPSSHHSEPKLQKRRPPKLSHSGGSSTREPWKN